MSLHHPNQSVYVLFAIMDRVGRRGKWLNLSTTSDEHSMGPEVIAHSFWWFCLHIKISLWTRGNALDQISGDWWVLHDFVCMWPYPNEKTCQFYIWLRSYTYVHNIKNNRFFGGSYFDLLSKVSCWCCWPLISVRAGGAGVVCTQTRGREGVGLEANVPSEGGGWGG